MKDILKMTKQDILKEIIKPKRTSESVKNSSSRFTRKIKLNYPPFIDVPTGKRRCGECGKLFKLEEFRKGEFGSGYYYKCKPCRKYEKVYK